MACAYFNGIAVRAGDEPQCSRGTRLTCNHPRRESLSINRGRSSRRASGVFERSNTSYKLDLIGAIRTAEVAATTLGAIGVGRRCTISSVQLM